MRSRVILVTGANAEIGFEVCRQSLVEGNRVIALYHNQFDRLQTLFDDYGDQLQGFKVDFSDPNAVKYFLERHSKILECVGIFISLAALRRNVSYGEISSEELIAHFTVNVIPVVLLTQYLGTSMARKGWGRIVIGSSIGVKFGGGDDTYCYSISKYASELIPKAARRWSEMGVLTNVARIGVTDTEGFRQIGEDRVTVRENLVPMKRLASPEEIACSILWFASEKNTYITGQVLAISGGE
jgi:NAD(P)-dependent dehydrogenase (short-subunit alcohol dehydrogenase family)